MDQGVLAQSLAMRPSSPHFLHSLDETFAIPYHVSVLEALKAVRQKLYMISDDK